MPTAGFSPIFMPPFVEGLGARCPIIKAITDNTTVVASDSGTIFHTTGATKAITFTLPAINTGPFRFTFIAGADQDLIVAAATADTAVSMNDLAADSVSFATSSEKIGGTIEVFCDGVTLFILGRPATTLQHVTVTS